MNFKVVITDSDYTDCDVEKRVLESVGADTVLYQCKTEDEVIDVSKDADALITNYAPITKSVLDHLTRLQIVVRYGVGVDNIDLRYATQKGVYVANVPDYCTEEVAEHTMALVLSMSRRIPWIRERTTKGVWDWSEFIPMTRLGGKTLGLVGFGRIGSSVARKAKALGMKILVFERLPYPEIEELGAKLTGLDDLLNDSDYVSIHLPLTDDTFHLLNAERLNKLKKDAVIVNTSRGAVIDQEALCSALRTNRIRGAALDVLENEPPLENDPILKCNNVIVTPHIAWYSEESAIALRVSAAEEVKRVLNNELPRNLINRDLQRAESVNPKL